MSTTNANRLEAQYGGISLSGSPHALSAWTVVALRIVMGGVMLFAGLGKVSEWPFDASGFLVHGVDAASPVSGLYAAMAETPIVLETINVVVPATQLLIGIALITGAFVRLAALGGAMQMTLFYLGGWAGDWLALFDSTLVYAFVFLAIGAFAAGRMAGLDSRIERLRVGGRPLLERYPRLRYVLG
ncbi:DoxX protein [Halovivax ruber XH-70]|uniref:DoxX protein n=1 Tax=Halovivax ruber (strain DSM 18193 / JCM 13892 / XH-70) TaxID=797302 RepID=L0IBV1_HALRX|nr:DoxX family membrane protein [Halovivax ruber]AGB15716.1 DoxX protein [Halovivax ruber XH-70]